MITQLLHRSRALIAGVLLVATIVFVRTADAQGIAPTSPLHNPDGSVAGFATTEPSLYFLAPSRWSPLPHAGTPAVRLTSLGSGSQTVYDLRLVLSPDYTRDTPTIVALRAQDPDAVFFPLPMNIKRVMLFLPAALGSIQAELVPDESGMSTPVALYYRLRFNAEQLGVLRTLAHGGLTMTGAINYAYTSPTGPAETATPLTIVLADADLTVSTASPPDSTAWLSDLLSITIFSATRPFDGPHTLSSGLTVQIANSHLDAWLLPGAWQLSAGSNSLQIRPTRAEDLAATLEFDLPQVGAHIRIDLRAAVALSLDLAFMQLSVTQFDVTTATVGGAPNAFYTALLRQLLQDPATRTQMSQALTEALQRRILSAAMVTVEDVLP